MLKFTKMEGIGNDYIYFDGIHQNIPINKSFIKKVSQRHFGIGSDGVIIILPSKQCDFQMRMFNLDGSEGKMCGNGIRCFAKFVYDHKLTQKSHLTIETLGGIKAVDLIIKDEKVDHVRVDMGKPSLDVAMIPCLFSKQQMVHEPIMIDDHIYHLTSLSMGNPHTVMFVDDLQLDIRTLGETIANSHLFPEGVNVEFAKIVNRHYIKMRVWERGSGETRACGTGACAVMFASYVRGLCDEHVQVELLGGVLDILYQDGKIFMTGPAKTTFEGLLREEDYAE